MSRWTRLLAFLCLLQALDGSRSSVLGPAGVFATASWPSSRPRAMLQLREWTINKPNSTTTAPHDNSTQHHHHHQLHESPLDARSDNEVYDELKIRRESDPAALNKAVGLKGPVKIPTAAELAAQKEWKKMTQGGETAAAEHEQSAMQIRQQRVANHVLGRIEQLSQEGRERIKLLTRLAKEQERLRVRAIGVAKQQLESAAQAFSSLEDAIAAKRSHQAMEEELAAHEEKLRHESAKLAQLEEISLSEASQAVRAVVAEIKTPTPSKSRVAKEKKKDNLKKQQIQHEIEHAQATPAAHTASLTHPQNATGPAPAAGHNGSEAHSNGTANTGNHTEAAPPYSHPSVRVASASKQTGPTKPAAASPTTNAASVHNIHPVHPRAAAEHAQPHAATEHAQPHAATEPAHPHVATEPAHPQAATMHAQPHAAAAHPTVAAHHGAKSRFRAVPPVDGRSSSAAAARRFASQASDVLTALEEMERDDEDQLEDAIEALIVSTEDGTETDRRSSERIQTRAHGTRRRRSKRLPQVR